METTVDAVTIPQRVAAGAAWLDQNRPGWWQNRPGWPQNIYLDQLDMSLDCGCVLGQLVGPYEWAIKVLDVPDPDALGFHIPWDPSWPGRYFAEYDALTAEWRKVIEARRVGAAS